MRYQNIKYHPQQKISAWRKISLASWKPKGDSSCYCFEQIEVENLLMYVRKFSVNLNTFIVKAVSKTLQLHPEINSTIRFGRIFRREDISVFFHTVENSERDDLCGVLLKEAQNKTIQKLNDEYLHKVNLSKMGKNDFRNSKKIIDFLPEFFTKIILDLYGFFAFQLNLNLPVFNMPKNAFGSVMITSVGSLGICEALCPIAPYTRVPMVISIGKIQEVALVENQQIRATKVINFGFTFDHRLMDGLHFSRFLETFRKLMKNPNELL